MSESPQWGDHVRYLTDDRDRKERYEFVMFVGGNGDYYVATVPEGHHPVREAVRICTSGGAASRSPRLLAAVSDAYRALRGEPEPEDACWACGLSPSRAASASAPPEDGRPAYAELADTAREMAAAVAAYFPFYAAECLNSGRTRSHDELNEIAARARDLLSRIPKETEG